MLVVQEGWAAAAAESKFIFFNFMYLVQMAWKLHLGMILKALISQVYSYIESCNLRIGIYVCYCQLLLYQNKRTDLRSAIWRSCDDFLCNLLVAKLRDGLDNYEEQEEDCCQTEWKTTKNKKRLEEQEKNAVDEKRAALI